ncbi:hypothetical protein [Spirochaeta dissipatitropha]
MIKGNCHRLSALVLILIFFSGLTSSFAQTAEPEPYHPDEFPQWALDIRRGSVIAFGAVPLTVMLTGIVYDVGRFTYHSLDQNSIAGEYAPLFFAPPDAVQKTEEERNRILYIGLSAAVIVAVADYILGLLE